MPADRRDPEIQKRRARAEVLPKGWPKQGKFRQARARRAYRRAVTVELGRGVETDPDSIRRKVQRKLSGPTRAAHLEGQAERRSRLQASPRKSEAARERRRQRRSRH